MSDETKQVQDALDALAAAKSPMELRTAHRETTRAIKRSRKGQQLGPLATAYGEAMVIIDQLREQGVSKEDRVKGLEQVIRDFWPFTRTWNYLCQACCDTGAIVKLCKHGDRCDGISTRTDHPFQDPGKYRRLCTQSDSYEHEYVTPCYCSLGNRFKLKPRHSGGDDFSSAGKSKKGMSRVGR